jgi:hypothetical protein
MSPPIIRIEIESMKHALNVMLSQHAALMSQEMQQAVDTFCTPERIQKLITETAHRELEGIVKDEIAAFFRYGAGRRSIRDSIQKQLNDMFPGEDQP